MMVIYIDENLPPQLAEGLNKLQEPLNKRNKTSFEIKSIKTVFGEGVKDEDWIPIAGKENAVSITQDFRIQTTRHQKELCENWLIFSTAPKRLLTMGTKNMNPLCLHWI